MWLFVGVTQVIYAEKMELYVGFMRQAQRCFIGSVTDVSRTTNKSVGLNYMLHHYLPTHPDLCVRFIMLILVQ